MADFLPIVLLVILGILVFIVAGLIKAVKQTLNRVEETLLFAQQTLRDINGHIQPTVTNLNAVQQEATLTLEQVRTTLSRLEGITASISEQVVSSARKYNELAANVDSKVLDEVSPMIKELRRLGLELQGMTKDVRGRLEDAQGIFRAIGETGDTVQDVVAMLRPRVTNLAIQVSSLITGANATIEAVSRIFSKKKGGKRNGL